MRDPPQGLYLPTDRSQLMNVTKNKQCEISDNAFKNVYYILVSFYIYSVFIEVHLRECIVLGSFSIQRVLNLAFV